MLKTLKISLATNYYKLFTSQSTTLPALAGHSGNKLITISYFHQNWWDMTHFTDFWLNFRVLVLLGGQKNILAPKMGQKGKKITQFEELCLAVRFFVCNIGMKNVKNINFS